MNREPLPAMRITRLFSSPDGDIALGPEDLKRPFLIRPSEPHPFLTLGDYFEAIQTFLLRDSAKSLMAAVNTEGPRKNMRGRIREIRIRSEKHGALYHVASIEALLRDRSVKLAVSTAISKEARSCLADEYEILKTLHRSHGLPYLPRVYDRGEVPFGKPSGEGETLGLMMTEWFDGWHEWHLSGNASDDRQQIAIWDLEKGCRLATKEEGFEIFRQAARILTLYYDPRSFKQIHPWCHAAGDFIVKTGDDGTHVRLTTARGYCSIMDVLSDHRVDPLIALVYFFLNLTIWMRLDKLDGVGKMIWAEDRCLQAVIAGFLDALQVMTQKGAFRFGQANRLLSLLRSLDEAELGRLFVPLMGFYEEVRPAESTVIREHLEGHVRGLHRLLLQSQ
jgi:hypothetical protein